VLDLTEHTPISLSRHWTASRERPPVPLPRGLYAGGAESNGTLTLWRDPLGCHKLFYGKLPAGDWAIANRICRLTTVGVRAEEIWSCPPGRIIQIEATRRRELTRCVPTSLPEDEFLEPDALHELVAPRLDETFEALARDGVGDRHVVCLSGGLDSAVIACWARRYLPGVVACSFSFCDDVESALRPDAAGELSEDFNAARRLAEALRLPLVPVLRPRAAVAAALPQAIVLGQDWRDFNVHCAVVNLFLAQGIRSAFPGERVVVLTGDLMNEYVCDYSEEVVDGVVYYRALNVSPARRRHFYVKGLDAGDREVGVFGAFGLTLVQPFAAVADLYMRLPARHLAAPNIKRRLNGPLLPVDVLDSVGRVKRRAQVGGSDGGVLGFCHRNHIDQHALMRMWSSSFPGVGPDDTLRFIELGAYRTQD
jgi:asparagine synthetase B (glutamine-hydrolysing)